MDLITLTQGSVLEKLIEEVNDLNKCKKILSELVYELHYLNKSEDTNLRIDKLIEAADDLLYKTDK